MVQDYFDYPGLLWFHIKFRLVLPTSVTNEIGVLNVTAPNLEIAFAKIVIFTVLILLICEHEKSFHFLSFFRGLVLIVKV